MTTTDKYWECECDTNIFHSCKEEYCKRCWAERDDSPDADIMELMSEHLTLLDGFEEHYLILQSKQEEIYAIVPFDKDFMAFLKGCRDHFNFCLNYITNLLVVDDDRVVFVEKLPPYIRMKLTTDKFVIVRKREIDFLDELEYDFYVYNWIIGPKSLGILYEYDGSGGKKETYQILFSDLTEKWLSIMRS